MYVLFDTAAGYALFKVGDSSKIASVDDVVKTFATAESAKAALKLKAFEKFSDTSSALSAITATCDGQLDENLSQFLQKNLTKDKEKLKLAVVDKNLGNLIKTNLSIKCVYDDSVLELMRGIRTHLTTLLAGLTASESHSMRLGLAHSLARYKLKFSPDKVDTMIIQAIALLDELDKELNTYAMRVKEWYGWHFPEMVKVLNDNILFAKTILKVGFRNHFKDTDLSDILPEDIEQLVKESAEVSMGTEISQEDLKNIRELCDQVVKISEYRASLFEYLKNRMNAIAPNLTVMVGELVGARLIAHAGSLLNLAKHPASTVQILGAEKALFRALKTKHDTPKYGLIYHASLVGQAPAKLKGKISRMLAAKSALTARMDALGDTDGATIGLDARSKVETRLRILEGGKALAATSTGPKTPNQTKYQKPTDSKSYNTASDVTNSMDIVKTPKKEKSKDNGKVEKKAAESPLSEEEEARIKRKEEKKKAKRDAAAAASAAANGDAMDEEPTAPVETEKEKKKEKKRKLVEDVTVVETSKVVENEPVEKKKKKKDKKKAEDDE